MIKKIKDLTLEELIKICNLKECYECPLNINSNYCYYDYFVSKYQVTKQLDLEKEVEVDD